MPNLKTEVFLLALSKQICISIKRIFAKFAETKRKIKEEKVLRNKMKQCLRSKIVGRQLICKNSIIVFSGWKKGLWVKSHFDCDNYSINVRTVVANPSRNRFQEFVTFCYKIRTTERNIEFDFICCIERIYEFVLLFYINYFRKLCKIVKIINISKSSRKMLKNIIMKNYKKNYKNKICLSCRRLLEKGIFVDIRQLETFRLNVFVVELNAWKAHFHCLTVQNTLKCRIRTIRGKQPLDSTFI